jgi:hypothetical protein
MRQEAIGKNPNAKAQMSNVIFIWNLGFGLYLEFGFWHLTFSLYP